MPRPRRAPAVLYQTRTESRVKLPGSIPEPNAVMRTRFWDIQVLAFQWPLRLLRNWTADSLTEEDFARRGAAVPI